MASAHVNAASAICSNWVQSVSEAVKRKTAPVQESTNSCIRQQCNFLFSCEEQSHHQRSNSIHQYCQWMGFSAGRLMMEAVVVQAAAPISSSVTPVRRSQDTMHDLWAD